jgi:hypothetical protein
MDLETVWEMREEQVYPALFGPVRRGIFPVDQALFTGQFGQTSVDPRWLVHGVFEYAPTADRPSWLYVTSGLSNPWEQEPSGYDPGDVSGTGVEFILPVARQGDWAIRLLQQVLAFALLLEAGRFPGADPLAFGDRIPLGAPIDGQPSCRLRHLLVVEPETLARRFSLPSGEVTLMALTGISDEERDLAKTHSSAALIGMLRAAGQLAITDPTRASLTE